MKNALQHLFRAFWALKGRIKGRNGRKMKKKSKKKKENGREKGKKGKGKYVINCVGHFECHFISFSCQPHEQTLLYGTFLMEKQRQEVQ